VQCETVQEVENVGDVSTNKVSKKIEIQKEAVEVMGDKEAFSAEKEEDEG